MKDGFNTIDRAKNSLRAFVFNVLVFDDISASTKIPRRFRVIKIFPTIKSFLSKTMAKALSFQTKKISYHQRKTPSRLTSTQNYPRKLLKRGEIDETTFNIIRPLATKPAQAHGNLKKSLNSILFFKLLIQHIKKLKRQSTVTPLTNIPRSIPLMQKKESKQLTKYIFRTVTSMFRSMSGLFLPTCHSRRTLRIIERRNFNEKLGQTKLKISTLQKPIRDTCTKTIIS